MRSEPLPEFLETMNAISGWMDRHFKTLDKNTLGAINAQIIGDVLGDSPSAKPRLPEADRNLGRLGDALLELHSGFERFHKVRVAAKYYPWRGRIRRSEHLEMISHTFLAEIYIYEERLKQYFDACMQCARVWGLDVDVKPLREKALKGYRSHFRRLLRARHFHTHESDVRFPAISRLRLIDLLSIGGDKFGFAKIAPSAFAGARKELLTEIDSAIRDLGELTSAVLRKTRVIWSRL